MWDVEVIPEQARVELEKQGQQIFMRSKKLLPAINCLEYLSLDLG